MAEEKKQEITLEEVPTQFTAGYKLPDGSVVTAEELLLWIANQVWEIKKAL